jgi:acyl carrier protein
MQVSEDELLELVAQAVELPSAALDRHGLLENIPQWDSLALINFIGLSNERFGVIVRPEQLSQARNLKDLVTMLDEALASGS